MNLSELFDFYIKAVNSTYIGGGAYSEAQRPGFSELTYEEGNFKYRDSYCGLFQSWGEEVIWENDKVVWTMIYGGGMELKYHGNKEFAFATFGFLKKAMAQKPKDKFAPRGPDSFKEGEYEYKCSWEGDMTRFKGSEKITLKSEIIFTHDFFGGAAI